MSGWLASAICSWLRGALHGWVYPYSSDTETISHASWGCEEATYVWGRVLRIFPDQSFDGIISWGMVAWADVSEVAHAFELDSLGLHICFPALVNWKTMHMTFVLFVREVKSCAQCENCCSELFIGICGQQGVLWSSREDNCLRWRSYNMFGVTQCMSLTITMMQRKEMFIRLCARGIVPFMNGGSAMFVRQHMTI
jgi:hypothetical protein